jgi:hypothetical protein
MCKNEQQKWEILRARQEENDKNKRMQNGDIPNW